MAVRIVDVTGVEQFQQIPPCADPGFDHRTCDYWEDADRGSKASRTAWLEAEAPPAPARPAVSFNPFAPDADEPAANPFAPAGRSEPAFNPFASSDDQPAENPFAPQRAAAPSVGKDAPRKLALLGRGLAVFGSYAKLLLDGEEPAAYAQFGPLSAYPRAQRLRELYPQLPDAPLPAVITCIATTAAARHRGYARTLVEAVCDDLARRGFAAVEAYPERGTRPDATSAATPEFWLGAAFRIAVDDERFPVVRRELG
ncbi:MAG TPA: GNAT family N-acetyltransferase [Candidatus Limnocylindrales bacterium]|nr:GNAT family N-acetyltransferase [Candidatus Limnocylindrales bacterium]